MLVICKLCFWVSLLFSCRVSDPAISDKIIDSIEFQESRSNIFVRNNGTCIGLMQVDYRYSKASKDMLRIPLVNRVVGVRALKNWKKRANGDIRKALAAYNCGNAGLRDKCGLRYSLTVLNRDIRYSRLNVTSCSIMGGIINSYLDNKDYLDKWRNKIWRYQHLHQLRLQR